ncbi:two-component hybrid sensor and regulator [Hyphomicrobium sulfonivorans]|uniref:histidine kinase n=2 Tax=Hyphomicrobium sulfonivorans TaxID=121290 RepID=A0A109BEB5_HYPSL|nr:two-component hybrid sensor and regulator [Hyphomicrobium sulfonivorans]
MPLAGAAAVRRSMAAAERHAGSSMRAMLHSFGCNYLRTERSIHLAAVFGVVAFAVGYFLYTSMTPLPQKYAGVWFAMGWGLSVMIAAKNHWPIDMRRHVVAMSYAALLYCLPFFTTLMLLMNADSTVWPVVSVASLIVAVQLYDVPNGIAAVVIGVLAAMGVFLVVTEGAPLPASWLQMLPVYGAVLAAAFALRHIQASEAIERENEAAALADQVAHECRTPLAGIRLEADGCEWLLNRLPESAARQKIIGSIRRMQQHVTSANSVIDLMLGNAGDAQADADAGDLQRMSSIVLTAVERYSFRPEERGIVRMELEEDFSFKGSDLLMTHVLFNLMQNGLRAIRERALEGEDERAPAPNLTIALKRGENRNSIIVSDTGLGIPPQIIDSVFAPYVTTQRIGIGAGLGLSFCRMIVEGIGGTITCSSRANGGTRFIIDLPVMNHAAQSGDA